ncbi:non-ribosomal peptide synthase/polyketide synthase [Pseudomonas purpurea]|uniref:non-ribosomal peptide synthase/polyketide synthase n=1 Tax=Pseudomonas purpurea TaxID=3136737 RepID=UPI003265E50D
MSAAPDRMMTLAQRFCGLSPEARRTLQQKMHAQGLTLELLPIPPRDPGVAMLPASYAQQRLWFLWQMQPEATAYNLTGAFRLNGELNVAALEQTLAALVQRHEVLRTTFVLDEQVVLQKIHAHMATSLIQVTANDEAELRHHVGLNAEQPFDLLNGPLMRCRLIRQGAQQHVLALTFHHIVTDGASLPILLQEFTQLYGQLSAGLTPALPELGIQYADFARWQRLWLEAGEAERQLDYWRGQLGQEHPPLSLPTDRRRPAIPSQQGASVELSVPTALSGALQALARREGCTLFMVLMASLQALLQRYSGERDIRVGVPIANRTRQDVENLLGFFVNTQVLRCQPHADQPFLELLAEVKAAALGAQAHQDLPFEQLVDGLNVERSLSHTPLFQVMFNHQRTAGGEQRWDLPGLRVEPLIWDEKTTKFDLMLDTVESDDGIHASFVYATELFDASTIERLGRHWLNLLHAITQDGRVALADLSMLDAQEHQATLLDWNRSAGAPVASSSAGLCAHQLIEAQVAAHPNGIAVTCDGATLTYAELNSQANRVAHRLRERGVGPDVLVGIALERSLEMIVSLLAILKAGGAYVPLDPEYPQDRLAYMLSDSGTRLLLTDSTLAPRLPLPDGVEVISLDDASDWLAEASAENLSNLTTPDNLAYVIYTSGSTGKPKGTLLPHANLTRLFSATEHWFGFGPDDVWSLFHSYAFDFSVWEIFGALFYGGKLVVVPHGTSRSPEDFAQLLRDEQVTVLNQTPSAFRQLMPFACANAQGMALRYVVFGGEALDMASLRPWYATFDDRQPVLVNMYGITETTVHVTYRPLSRLDLDGANNSPLGEPIPDLRWYVLDPRLNPVAKGCVGELYVGGAGLARAYHQRPDLTAPRFVPDLFSTEPGVRLYRTGDLARYCADGSIEYAGRIDHQVKIRGFRIELGEIQDRLQSHPAIEQALVLAPQVNGSQQLVAYFTLKQDDAELRQSLLEHLRAGLPDYMVPVHLLTLDSWPLTSNGKLDRGALPTPDAALAQQDYSAPTDDMQAALVAIWQDVLKIERIGISDNFFELGGDSIISIQVVSRARQAGIRITPRDLFQHQTVQSLAGVAERSAGLVIDQGPVRGEVLLTPIQHWFFAQHIESRNHWNQSVLLELREPLDSACLQQALTALLEHHDALRLRFLHVDGVWQQAQAEQWSSDDLLWQRQATQAEELLALCDAAQASLDLQDGPLLRALLVDMGAAGQRLLLVVHHLAVDGVSWRLLLEDLQAAYTQARQGETLRLPAKTSAYKDWAARLQRHAQSTELRNQAAYWQGQYRDVQVELPADNPQGSLASEHAVSVETLLDSTLTRQLLQDAPAAYRTQVNDLLLTALARVLGNWTGQSSTLVKLEGHGREDLFDDIDLTRTLGWFTSIFPVKLTPASDLAASIKAVKEQLRAVPDKGIGFGILRYLGDAGLGDLPEPQVTFNYMGQFDASFDEQAPWRPARESGGAEQGASASLDRGLSINGQVYAGQLRLSWTFSGEVFARENVQRLADAYALELQLLIEHCLSGACGLTPSDVPLVSVDQAQLDALPMAARQIEDIFPLSPMQEGMLFHSLFAPDAGAYIPQMRVDVQGIEVEAFRTAWQQALDRHEILRAAFFSESNGSRPLQVILADVQLPLTVLDWRDKANLPEALERLAEEDRQRGFDLTAAPLLRLTLVRTAADSHHLIFTNHHILLDGWSTSQLFGEVLQRYSGITPAASSGRYRDYMKWLGGRDRVACEAFWLEQLQTFTEPTRLAGALSAPTAAQALQELGHQTHHLTLERDATERLNQYARQARVTPNTLLQAAWLLLLQRYTGQRTVAFGATVSGRPSELQGIEQQVGLFINTLPVIATPHPEQCAAQWVAEVQALNLKLRDVEHTPLADVQRWAGHSGESLFDTLLVFENYPVAEALENGNPSPLKFSSIAHCEQTSFPLSLAAELGESLLLRISYDSALFARDAIGALTQHLVSLLDGLCTTPECKLGDLPMLSNGENRLLLEDWNHIETRYRLDECVHEVFEAQVARAPDSLALIFGERQLSYAELNARANRLARRLREQGAGPEQRVGLAVERSVEMVIALLAVLKSGAAYVPLDPAYPQERLTYMMADSGIRLLLSQARVVSTLPVPAGLNTLLLDDADAPTNEADAVNLPNLNVAQNLAYLIYTSGSTGQPKGVAVTHGPLVMHCRSIGDLYGMTPQDRELQFASINFDGAHERYLTPLLFGSALMPRDNDLWGVDRTVDEIERHGITIACFTPSYLQQLADYAGEAGRRLPIRSYTVGGEATSRACFDHIQQTLQPPRIINGYGPTETVVTPLIWRAHLGEGFDAQYMPIGRPVGERTAYVLDQWLNPVPVGVSGELYIGGGGLARGYHERPGLSAERFVPDPFARDSGQMLYRTGDLVQYRADGVVAYIGRIDHQVKIRGFRIELGEIETRLLTHPQVSETVVVAHDAPRGKQLVAYLVLTPDADGQAEAQIKAWLQAHLPDYMVPAHLIVLTQMPLNPAGKLDRHALPAPQIAQRQQQVQAPTNEMEAALLAIWQDVLNVSPLGVKDNFFELGGDSIISIQVVSRARHQGIRFTPKDVFQHQTVRELAAVARLSSVSMIDQGPVLGELALTPIQHWFFEQDIPQRHHWNQSVLLDVREPLQSSMLESALQHVHQQHDALRLRWHSNTSGAWQAEHAAIGEQPLLTCVDVDVADSDALLACCEQAQTSLDLEQGPLLRAVHIRLADGGERLLLVVHHLVIDGVSWRILLEDVQSLYRQQVAGQAMTLPAKTSAFQSWSRHLHDYAGSPQLLAELPWWQAQAGDHGTLPQDNPQGSLQTRHFASVSSRLDSDLTRQLLQQAPAAYRTRINELLLTALARVICRWSGQPSVQVQLEGHGREGLFEEVDLTRTVGWFTSMFPLRLTPADDLASSIKGIKEHLRRVPNNGIGYGVLRYLGQQPALENTTRITFNYLGQFDQSFDEHALFVPASESSGSSHDDRAPLGNWLNINGQVYGAELVLSWSFSREMYREDTVQYLADAYSAELRALIEHCLALENAGVTPSDFPLAGLDQAQLDGLPLAPSVIEDIYPLSPMQQGMLFHSLIEADQDDGAGAYINQLRMDIDGLDVPRFQQAWQTAFDRHAILRASFHSRADLPQALQVIARQVAVPLQVEDWRDQAQLPARLDALADEQRLAGFVLDQAPLLRLQLVRTSEGRHHFIYTSHHILMDGWSSSQLFGEILQSYAGQALARTAGQYRDYIGWLQRQDAALSEAFWKPLLAQLDTPTRLAASLPALTVDGPERFLEWHHDIEGPAMQGLSEFARASKVTLNSLVQAAWLLLLQRYTGQPSVAFGATVAGRSLDLPGIEEQLGLFINTLPVIATPQPEASVLEWLAQVQQQNLALREFEHTPLYDIQRWSGAKSDSLFDNILVFENYPVAEALEQSGLTGLKFSDIDSHEQTNYPLTLSVEQGESLSFGYSYSTAHFTAERIERLHGHLVQLLMAMSRDPARTLGALPMLSLDEQQSVVDGWGTRALALPSSGQSARVPFMHQRFEAMAAVTPEALALVFEGRSLTYRELNGLANHQAYILREHGVTPDMRVGIAVDRSLEMVVGLLAILKAGGAYVPLDPEYPQDRLAHMISDSNLTLLLSQQHLLAALPIPEQLKVLCLDQACPQGKELAERVAVAGADVAAGGLSPDNLAYVIYTSGSTGMPKGVAISHQAFNRHCDVAIDYFRLTPQDRVLLFSTLNFDGFVEQLYPALCHGAAVVIRGNLLWDSETFYQNVLRSGITVADLPTSYWFLLAQDFASAGPRDYGSLRQVSATGEAMPPQGLSAWKAAGLESVRLLNTYGPTETTVTATFLECADYLDGQRAVPAVMPIGLPLAGRSMYVLDAWLNPLPSGVTGELYIGGDLLARGYHGRPALSAERFVADPFSQQPGGRLYRTGDLVRYSADGEIEYIGRVDHQVKVRGFRIELGEIESRLQQHEQVREAVVVALEGAGGKQLVGYVVAVDGSQCDALRVELLELLAETLPDYMLPNPLILLDSMPLTPGGKLDRSALPAPDWQGREYVAPGSRVQRQLAAVWQQVLGVERVGLTDNFFELGGNSILALQVVAKAKALSGVTLSLRDLMSRPSIGELVQTADEEANLNPLLLLNTPVNTQPGLFCIHGGFGTVFDYQPLARRLDGQRSVFGLQSRMLLSAQWQDDDFESIAIDYAQYIRQQQPQGPYQLLGWSLGGPLAMLVAHELEKQGQPVEFVGVLDSALVGVDNLEPWQVALQGFLDSVLPGQPAVVFAEQATEPDLAELTALIGRGVRQGGSLQAGVSAHDLALAFTVDRRLSRLAAAHPRLPTVSAEVVSWVLPAHAPAVRETLAASGNRIKDEYVIDCSHTAIVSETGFLDSLQGQLQEVLATS